MYCTLPRARPPYQLSLQQSTVLIIEIQSLGIASLILQVRNVMMLNGPSLIGVFLQRALGLRREELMVMLGRVRGGPVLHFAFDWLMF